MQMIRGLHQRIIKDISDFIKATGNKPDTILITGSAFSQLEDDGKINKDGEGYIYENISIKKTDNINKVWILI